MLPEIATKVVDWLSLLDGFDAAVLNDDGSGLRLISQPDVYQTMFLDVLLGEYLLKAVLLDAPAALLQLLQNVERQWNDYNTDQTENHKVLTSI